MIREVYVDGYRSLENLKIPVAPGVNILVGPNGGGKTNVLSFFEFLSSLPETPVDEAVSSHGGIGRVFTRLQDDKYKTSLDCTIRGSTVFQMKNGAPKTLWYTWRFSIGSSESYEDIQYTEQALYLNVTKEPINPEASDLILKMSIDEHGSHLNVDRIIISKLQHLFRGFAFVDVGTYLTYAQAVRILRNYARYTDLGRDSLFEAFPPQMTLFHKIKRDVSGGQIFNFVPEVCKTPDDSSRPPVMDKRGAGLASVLHRLSTNTSSLFGPSRIRRRPSPDLKAYKRISSYVKLVSPSVTGIETQKSALDNKISVFVLISENDGEVRFPLAQCSDGTVKWIALVTKVITANSGFSIEEPENFMHPAIQKEFLQIVRTESRVSAFSPFTMITTHSESLLNEADPSEVILVWMEAGKTVAKRVSNSADLTSEINRTGFGLGYYYTSGALEGA